LLASFAASTTLIERGYTEYKAINTKNADGGSTAQQPRYVQETSLPRMG
jgi:hypothetical protein